MIFFPFLALSATSFIMKVVMVLFIIVCVVLILVVLIQKGRGGGLSAAFGGGTAGGILGSKTGDFLTWLTVALVGVFLTLAVIMAMFHKPIVSDVDTGPPIQQSAPPGQQQVPAVPGETAGSDANS